MTRHSLVVVGIAALLLCAALLWRYVPGLWPAIGPAAPLESGTPQPSVSGAAAPSGPLTVPDGWTSELVTDGVSGARDLTLDAFGNVWVSRTAQGVVSTVYLADVPAGERPQVANVLTGLRKPHGLAFDPEHPTMLYIATETAVSKIPTYSDGRLEHVADLPGGGRHFTRSLAFGPDGRLYVSIGSTCDVCEESDAEIATVISMLPDGSDRRTEATGLRNAVFLAFHPRFTDALWATEMGRDRLGDTLPPDEINVIEVGGEAEEYGWPVCYGDRVHDSEYDTKQYVRNPCEDTLPPVISLPAHVAPLGLAFLPDGDLLVSYHGSWNSSVPVGYKVVRWHWDGTVWSSSDFVSGFLRGASAFGRPVDVLPMPDGSVLISDDKAGAIWRVAPAR